MKMDNRDLNAMFVLIMRHRLSAANFETAAKKEFMHLDLHTVKLLRETAREARNEIYDHFAEMVDPANLKAVPQTELKLWLKESFDWMDDEALRLAYNDGLARTAG